MKSKLSIILPAILLIIILFWKFYKQNDKIEIEDFKLKNEYIHTKAKIERVTPSGIRAKRSTILFVKYIQNDENFTATIRREGYKEGNYKIGDTITIYIDPTNQSVIK